MAAERILITGGAGFIGTHLARRLRRAGREVRVLDLFVPQVHPDGDAAKFEPGDGVEVVRGDVCDAGLVAAALRDVDAVIHLAARVGVGQSMYETVAYTRGNVLGTAVLLEALARRPVRKLVVASSMSIYGEGLYRDGAGRVHDDLGRTREDLLAHRWEPSTPGGEPARPVPTPEDKRPQLSSIYALGKYDQERMCLLFGAAYDVPAVALRLFNVYGPGQTLSNPYTGVLAIFAGRILSGLPPLVYEDGLQRRDFVSVEDVAEAFLLALDRPGADGMAVNVASGESHTVLEIAERLAAVLGRDGPEPSLPGRFRVGDIRHCFAATERARDLLGFRAGVDLDTGLTALGEWLEGQTVAAGSLEQADTELLARGLTR
jgi:dTDP-L-rhamnose 4-epimerase